MNSEKRVPTILILEDEPTTQLILKTALLKHGYSVVLCSNGAAGLYELLSRGTIDAMLVDIMMPDVNGDDFLKVVESMQRQGLLSCRSRAIVYTSVTNIHELRKYTSFDCVHCVLQKNVTLEKIVQEVEAILNGKSTEEKMRIEQATVA